MAGTVIRVLPKTDYDYSVLPASAQSAGFPVALNIDVSKYREITFLVRAHSLTLTNSGAKLMFSAYAEAPTSEDPAVVFRESAALGSTTFQSPAAAPPGILQRISLAPTSYAGGSLTLVLTAIQSNPVSTIKGTFSVDVSLKE